MAQSIKKSIINEIFDLLDSSNSGHEINCDKTWSKSK